MRRTGFAYVNIPVTLWHDLRVMRLPENKRAAAMGVFLRALCYTREEELDGFLPDYAVHMVGRKKVLEQLEAVGFLTRDERDGDHGYYLPDYVLWNETKQQRLDTKKRQRERKVPPPLRAEVVQRDGLICALCAGVVVHNELAIDHRHPVSLGGPTTLDNLQVAHRRCNSKKGNRLQ